MPALEITDDHGCTWRRLSTGMYAPHAGRDPSSRHFGMVLTASQVRALS